LEIEEKGLDSFTNLVQFRLTMARGRKRKSIKMKQRRNQVKKKTRAKNKREAAKKARVH